MTEKNSTLEIRTDGAGRLIFCGPMTVLGGLEKAFAEARKLAEKQRIVTTDLSQVTRMDTAGGLWWLKFAGDMGRKLQVDGMPPAHKALLEAISALPEAEDDSAVDASHSDGGDVVAYGVLRPALVGVGRAVCDGARFLVLLAAMFGQVLAGFGQVFTGRRSFRSHSFIRHVREAGVQAVPIVFWISFLMSIVLAYQGVAQLQMFGAQKYAINLVAVSVLREMGGLLAAIMVAGRSGSAFTSEIGVMKLREEVDALRVTGLDPLDVLVLPRVAALVVVLPLLTMVAFAAGLVGGGVVALTSLGLDIETYLGQFAYSVTVETMLVGLVKAPVFAVVIALIACLNGVQVQGSADSVGRQTTRAVVQGIFAVLVIDAVFSVFFAKVGI